MTNGIDAQIHMDWKNSKDFILSQPYFLLIS